MKIQEARSPTVRERQAERERVLMAVNNDPLLLAIKHSQVEKQQLSVQAEKTDLRIKCIIIPSPLDHISVHFKVQNRRRPIEVT